MSRSGDVAFRLLAALTMILCFLIGGALLFGFFTNVLLPLSMQPASLPIATDYWGFYMMGFAGTLLITWGACLLAAVRAPAASRGIGTATAVGLVVNAVFRMLAWFSGEYAEVGNLPRVESAVMLLLALGFIWARPPRMRQVVQ